ncbi:hypothetical protein KFL_003640020 [Klebsormidium nitens]|uniref:Uncharacterized protein n=1 Tax=Klebsormidium nitens TaxID=105231 RepID=A0A1Y1I9I4_KLENI|nr:hypothetical protein KFL_003640020 [Klebsormidium nitens]|eukprot:GAQ87600.1 hypothetical protein KFL_003640020 [Klebsormidium nitens]
MLHLPGPYLPRPVLPREHRAQCLQATSGSRGSLTPRAFLEDDQPFPATVTQRDMAELSLRARLESKYSSQLGAGIISTFGRHDLLQRKRDLKENFGGSPPGGGKNNGRGRGDGGGGGGGGGEGQTAIYLLPVLTLVFAAVFLGYAVAVGLKEEGMNMDFLRTSAGLFGLLALAAFRVNNQTGIDAFILGLGASTAVMVWTGERFVVRKEIAPAGIVTILAASMAVIFTGALYHSL